jgi:uridylate kinase
MVKVLSLGGSIVAPSAPDPEFLAALAALLRGKLEADPELRFILVVGGGGPARSYQEACRKACPSAADEDLDWIGIMATRLNAQLVKAVMGRLCPGDVVIDPLAVELFSGRVMVAAGWKPGFSTDYDAVVLAERFGAAEVLNLSNIAQVYSADPRTDPSAKPLESLSWAEFRGIVGGEWKPGTNLPFDPVATRRAAELGLRVVCAAGRDLANLELILDGKPFHGTLIHP